MLAERCKVLIVTFEPNVIDEQSDPNASFSGFDDAVKEERSTVIAAPEKGLDIDGGSG